MNNRENAAYRGNAINRRQTGRRNNSKMTAGNKKFMLYVVLLWIFVCINVILLLQLRAQVNSLNDAMNLMRGRLLLLEEQECLNQDYQAAPPSNTVDGVVIAGYAEQWGMSEVAAPRERTYREILERLRELGEESELIRQVAESAGSYPEKLLEALANNPEMADFAAHYLENKGIVSGEGLTEKEKTADFPLFLQWDPRWGYASYGDDSVVGLSGCGPTALSMVLYYMTGDETLTPDKLAAYSMKNGYYISGTGTAWLLLENVPPHYGISVSQPKPSEQTMKQALDNGQLIICSMGPGDFTIGGHFIVIYGYDQEGFLLNDPNCVARSNAHWTYAQLDRQIKNIWTFRKGAAASDITAYTDVISVR